MANKVYDFFLSGINSIVRLGKSGNSLESHNNSHIEFLANNGDLLPIRTKTPVHLSDSVSLEFLRENVLLSYGLPVQNISELKAIPEVDRRDKQIRMVEDETTFYQYDEQSMAIVPDPDNPKKSVLPDDRTLAVPGRWLFTKGRTQYHTDLIGNDSGDDHPQYQLRNERDQPDGFLGLDSNSKLNADTDRLDEGSNNQYFTGARARAETVEDSINPSETEKAPSQRVVFDELATKEDSILGGTGFWDGTKTFRPVEITDIPGLDLGVQGAYDAIGDLETNKEDSIISSLAGYFWDGTKVFRQILMGDILNLVSTLAGKEDTITASTSDKFWDGTKDFRNIEIEDVVGLENSMNYLNDNKENNLPPGNPGEYLHSDKTFKPIDYSEIVGTPPASSGSDPNEIVFIFSNFSDPANKIYNDWNNLLADFELLSTSQRKAIILEENATWDITGSSLFYDFSKTRFIGRPRIPTSSPDLNSLGYIYRNIPRPRLIFSGNDASNYGMVPPYSIENIAVIIQSTLQSSFFDGEMVLFGGKKSDFDIILKDFSFYSENSTPVKLLGVAGGFGSGTNIILDGEVDINKHHSNMQSSLIDYTSIYSGAENHNIIIKPGCFGNILMSALIGNSMGFSGSGSDKLKMYMSSISVSLQKDINNYLTSEPKIQLIDSRFRANTQGMISSGLDDFDSMVSLGGKQIRNDIHPVTLTLLGNYSLDSLTVLDCAVSGMYSKEANGNSTIYLMNIGIGQQVILEVVSNGSPSALTFLDGSNYSPIIWLDGSQPAPSTTAGNTDLYIFLKMQSKIYVSTFMDL